MNCASRNHPKTTRPQTDVYIGIGIGNLETPARQTSGAAQGQFVGQSRADADEQIQTQAEVIEQAKQKANRTTVNAQGRRTESCQAYSDKQVMITSI